MSLFFFIYSSLIHSSLLKFPLLPCSHSPFSPDSILLHLSSEKSKPPISFFNIGMKLGGKYGIRDLRCVGGRHWGQGVWSKHIVYIYATLKKSYINKIKLYEIRSKQMILTSWYLHHYINICLMFCFGFPCLFTDSCILAM